MVGANEELDGGFIRSRSTTREPRGFVVGRKQEYAAGISKREQTTGPTTILSFVVIEASKRRASTTRAISARTSRFAALFIAATIRRSKLGQFGREEWRW